MFLLNWKIFTLITHDKEILSSTLFPDRDFVLDKRQLLTWDQNMKIVHPNMKELQCHHFKIPSKNILLRQCFSTFFIQRPFCNSI